MAVRLPPWGRPKLQSGRARSGREAGAARPRCRFVESLSGRTGMSGQDHTPTAMTRPCSTRRGRVAAVTPYLSQCGPRLRGGERGVMGAPRSRQFRRAARGVPRELARHPRRRPVDVRRHKHRRCSASSIQPTSISEPATPTWAIRRRPSASASSRPSRPPIDLAIEERVDLFLIAGDLFDSNTQPRRSAERVAAELARLAAAKVRTVIIPGTHDVYDRSSIYRAYDLEALAGSDPDDDFVTVLTPARPWVHLAACDVVVFGHGVRDQEGTEEPARRASTPRSFPRRRTGSGWSTARSRSPARPTATTS